MYPIALDLTKIPVLLVGKGEIAERRAKWLKEAGANRLRLQEFATPDDVRAASVVLVAGLPREEAEKIVGLAHAAGKLVNVEDVNDLCDFYFTANVTRGDLVIAVSTSGASPTLARKVRDWIGVRFGEEWADYTRELKTLRKEWKDEGRNVMATSEDHIKKKGWLG